MATLNSSYFKSVHTETKDGFTYNGYVPIGNPMILFSEVDGAPLAALHFAAQETDAQRFGDGTRGVGLVTERPSEIATRQLFQGMMNRDKQDFLYVHPCNLTLRMTHLSTFGIQLPHTKNILLPNIQFPFLFLLCESNKNLAF